MTRAFGIRPGDLIRMAASALARHRTRTALTVAGVAIGTFALVASLAIGRGVDGAITNLFNGTDALRQVLVRQNYDGPDGDVPEADRAVDGTMTDAKRARLRHARVRTYVRKGGREPRAVLNLATLDRLAAIPGVARTLPIVGVQGPVTIDGLGPRPGAGSGPPPSSNCQAADPDDQYLTRLIAGRGFSGDTAREAIVHEYLLYRLGLTGDDVAAALGKTIRVTYKQVRGRDGFNLARILTFGLNPLTPEEAEAAVRAVTRVAGLARFLPIPADERAGLVKLLGRTPAGSDAMKEDVFTDSFTIVGVVREAMPDDPKVNNPIVGDQTIGSDVILPRRAAAEFALKAPGSDEIGMQLTILVADREDDVMAVSEAVEAIGFHASSLVRFLETIRLNVLMITIATAFIAVVALTVAAIGITNTMIMSVLERTHEIGIMKALGARTAEIRSIFLVEGTIIGAIGGGLGLLIAWLVSIPGDRLARSIMQAQSPRPVQGSLFAFPAWLVVGAPILAALVTMIASVYPAHRAARVDPITSLRHD